MMASIIVHAGSLTSLEIFRSKSTGNLILRGLQIISSHTVQAQHVAVCGITLIGVQK